MPEFSFEAASGAGDLQQGQINGENERDVIRELSSRGLTVISVAEVREQKVSILTPPLSRQDLTMAMHEMATLIESDVNLADALSAQQKGSYHPKLKQAFGRMSRELTQGETFGSALKVSGLQLPDYMLHLVQAGEASGQLGQSLRGGVAQMEYDHKVASDFRAALTYPGILVSAGLGAVVLIFSFVVPKFANLLDRSDELNPLAEVVLRTGVWFNANLPYVLLGMVGLVLAAISLLRRPEVREWLLDFLARLPVIGEWLRESDTAKWASVMSTMLDSRVELILALDLAREGVRIRQRKRKLAQVRQSVQSGISLGEALATEAALTPTGYNMIRVGEQSGRLASMLSSLARLYEENSRRRIAQVLTIIEPVAIIVIGSVIGIIITGIVLAITSVNEVSF